MCVARRNLKGVPRWASWCCSWLCSACCVCAFKGFFSRSPGAVRAACFCYPLSARRTTQPARVHLGGPLAVFVLCVASSRARLRAGLRLPFRSLGSYCCGLLYGFLLRHRTSQPLRAFLGGPLEVFALRGCIWQDLFGVRHCTDVSQAYSHVRAVNASA